MSTSKNSPIEAALKEMARKGYDPKTIVPDGKFHRYGLKGSQWYVARSIPADFDNGKIMLVAFGDWRTGEKHHFKSRADLNAKDVLQIEAQWAKLDREAEEQQEQLHDETAVICEAKWNTLKERGTHLYLNQKKIHTCKNLGVRFAGDILFVPMKDTAGKLWSYQRILGNGKKRFAMSGKVRGCFHVIGDGDITGSRQLLIAEGFATAASIHMATGLPVVTAFNADNLLNVARALKGQYPDKQFVICGDDDRWTQKPDGSLSNPGRKKAKQAAKEVGGSAVFPIFQDSSSRPTDFNDLHCQEGITAVSDQFAAAQTAPREKEDKLSQATILLQLAERATLFHTPEGDDYARIPIGDHEETWPVRSTQFKNWLLREYYQQRGKSVPGSQAIQDALAGVSAKAQIEGEEMPVFLRVAQQSDKVYVDLCNDQWEAVEIDAEGWRISSAPPVRFRRSKGMLSLPNPVRSDEANISDLRQFLNVETKQDFRLVVAWLINCFNPTGPYLALVLYGEQGTAKSTTVRMLRSLIDPNEVPLRREPSGSDDLLVSAKANWTVVTDNMSYLSPWLSDDFCRLATGGGLSKRSHYTNDEEFVLNAKRPLILNGISEFVVRGDLASRSITLHLPTIQAGARKREKTLVEEFEKARPRLLGLLLDAVAAALRNQGAFEAEEHLRMADAWHWVSAAEPAFGWKRGTMVEAYRKNQLQANDAVLNSSPVYPFLRELAEKDWEGTAEELLTKLNFMREGSSSNRFDRKWPRSPKNLSDQLRGISPALRLDGIEIEHSQTSGSGSKKLIAIRKMLQSCDAIDAKPAKRSKNAKGVGRVAETPTKSRARHSSMEKADFNGF